MLKESSFNKVQQLDKYLLHVYVLLGGGFPRKYNKQYARFTKTKQIDRNSGLLLCFNKRSEFQDDFNEILHPTVHLPNHAVPFKNINYPFVTVFKFA